MRSQHHALGIALCGAVAACGAASARPTTTEHANSRYLTTAELTRVSPSLTAYEAIERLRPFYLRPRPVYGRAAVISVYINGSYAGNADVLRTLTPGAIQSARYLQRSEATAFAGVLTPGDSFIMVTLVGMGASRR
jgi:hypothetical protein